MKRDEIKEAIKIGIPIILGYGPAGITYGLLAKGNGIGLVDTSLFSLIVYAGASQFMALDLILAGVSWASIILATFLLNLRHFVMSASLGVELGNIDKKLLPLIGFGITDETFSLISFNKDKITATFLLTINMMGYFAWTIWTLVGYLMGEILPESLQSSLGIGLYAMFAALLFPKFKDSTRVIRVSIISAVIYIILFYSKIFASGWDIILGIVLSSLVATILFRKRREDND